PDRGQGLPFPIDTMFACYTVFQAYDDERATAALHLAVTVMQRTADEIEDPEMRQSFLTNVPVNQALQALLP
ncbi:MAG: hypothetical protein KDE34_24175, partial [Anaerolineales bacterium]|nr:hypothetical protein [Anaerolineales bacterium]